MLRILFESIITNFVNLDFIFILIIINKNIFIKFKLTYKLKVKLHLNCKKLILYIK